MRIRNRGIGRGLTLAALGLLLGGCEARFTADLATDAPADPGISRVQVNLRGLEFRKADGKTPTLEFRDGELVDLLQLRSGDPLRLFTDEQLPSGSYSGVRLLFDEDEEDNAVRTVDGDFPLRLAAGEFAVVDFSVEDEERTEEALTLMLDLRQSLSFDEVEDEYTLQPRLRALSTNEAARIEGDVGVTCPLGTSLSSGGAVYAFAGRDVQPDDLDGVGAEPLATTRVVQSGFAGFRYALRFLPAGAYTISVTCQGDEDALGSSDELGFRGTDSVELDPGDVQQRDLE